MLRRVRIGNFSRKIFATSQLVIPRAIDRMYSMPIASASASALLSKFVQEPIDNLWWLNDTSWSPIARKEAQEFSASSILKGDRLTIDHWSRFVSYESGLWRAQGGTCLTGKGTLLIFRQAFNVRDNCTPRNWISGHEKGEWRYFFIKKNIYVVFYHFSSI